MSSRYFCKLWVVLSVMCLLVTFQAQSAEFVAQPSPIDRELDLERKRLREDMINNELRDAEEKSQAATVKEDDLDLPEEGVDFEIQHINIESDLALPIATEDLLQQYQGKPVNRRKIYELIRALSIRLHGKGYTTTTVGLPKQNIANGMLSLRVKWGLVEGWTINGQTPSTIREHLLVNMTLPMVIGRPLNIYDIDQAIENLNTVSKSAKIDIVPSEKVGYSILDIKLAESQASHVSLSMDNSSPVRAENGRDRYNASLTLGDTLLPNDSLTLSGNAKYYEDRNDNKEQGASVRYSVPIGATTLSVQQGFSIYKKLIVGINGSYVSSGNSSNNSFEISRNLYRVKDKKLTVFSNLRHKTSENFLAGNLLEVNSKNYTETGAGARWVSALWSGSIYADMTYNRGLSWWNGADGAVTVVGENPKTGFTIETPKNYWSLVGTVALNQNFKIAALRMNYGARLGWQYTQDHLLGSYQLGIGDEFTVRGYKGTPLFADKGVYLAQTWGIPMPFLWGGQIEPFIGFDIAYVGNNGSIALNPNPKRTTTVPFITYSGDENRARATLSGNAIGVKFQQKNFGWSLTYGHPLNRPTWLVAGDVIYFNANLNF